MQLRKPAQSTTVVVVSSSEFLISALNRALPARFAVVAVPPGPHILRTLRRERPQIALIDGIDERRGAAQLEIALLKEMYPDTRIIAVSGKSSDADASIVEQGIFYYTSTPELDELVRIIQAAERALAERLQRTS